MYLKVRESKLFDSLKQNMFQNDPSVRPQTVVVLRATTEEETSKRNHGGGIMGSDP